MYKNFWNVINKDENCYYIISGNGKIIYNSFSREDLMDICLAHNQTIMNEFNGFEGTLKSDIDGDACFAVPSCVTFVSTAFHPTTASSKLPPLESQ